jgi:hypothetical protein
VANLRELFTQFEATYGQKISFDAQQFLMDHHEAFEELGQAIIALQSELDVVETEQPGSCLAAIREIDQIVGEVMKQIRSRYTRAGKDENEATAAAEEQARKKVAEAIEEVVAAKV